MATTRATKRKAQKSTRPGAPATEVAERVHALRHVVLAIGSLAPVESAGVRSRLRGERLLSFVERGRVALRLVSSGAVHAEHGPT